MVCAASRLVTHLLLFSLELVLMFSQMLIIKFECVNGC